MVLFVICLLLVTIVYLLFKIYFLLDELVEMLADDF